MVLVVDGELDREVTHRFQLVDIGLDIVHQQAFRDLKVNAVVTPANRFLNEREELALTQLNGGNVHRDARRPEAFVYQHASEAWLPRGFAFGMSPPFDVVVVSLYTGWTMKFIKHVGRDPTVFLPIFEISLRARAPKHRGQTPIEKIGV